MLDPVAKQWGSCEGVVPDTAIRLIELGFRWSPSEVLAEPSVLDSYVTERLRERRLIEPRRKARARRGSDIGDRLDPVDI
jgi:hypothetical protein